MAPLSEEQILWLFGAWSADIDSEPYAHEDDCTSAAGLLAEESAA